MPKILDYSKYTETTLNVDDTLAAAVLKNSHGNPTMSDEDVKIAILSLLMTCKRQQSVIDELVVEVNTLRETTRKFRFPFKK